MTEPAFLVTPSGRRIAYHYTPGRSPGVVFLGGFRSDMTGTKAIYLQQRAQARGQAYLRFDYSGHGQSSGDFLDGAIGDWFEDALAVVQTLTEGRQVLVGSSMGGWIALLLARTNPDRVHGLVGVAAAPDFTEDGFWAGFSAAKRATLLRDGRVTRHSNHAPQSDVITRRLIEDGRARLVLRTALDLPFPVRLLHGAADIEVPVSVPLALLYHASGPDMRLTLVKGADHRFSTPECLALLGAAIDEVAHA